MAPDSAFDVVEAYRPYIERALRHSGGTHSFEDVKEAIEQGLMQLWPVPGGCIVTEILQFPRRRVLNVFLGGGDMAQLLDLHESVIAWAREQGCDAVRASGRWGWKRVLPKHGWEPMHMNYERSI